MLVYDGVGLLLLLALWLFCLIDVITTDESLCRNLPKMAWIFIVFILPDGKMMEINLAGFKSLDQSFWGQIYLRDEKFYKKLCEVASKHAGRPIDVLKGDTKPREPGRP